MVNQLYDIKFTLYQPVKANHKWLISIRLILSFVHLSLLWEKKYFQFLHFSFWASLCAYLQYDWFILSIPIFHHTEVQPNMRNLNFHLIILILLFHKEIQFWIHLKITKIKIFIYSESDIEYKFLGMITSNHEILFNS